MLKYLKKYWFFCLLAPLFMIGEVAMDLLQPDMMADIVDNGVLNSNMELIVTVGIKMILTVMLGGLCGILCAHAHALLTADPGFQLHIQFLLHASFGRRCVICGYTPL